MTLIKKKSDSIRNFMLEEIERDIQNDEILQNRFLNHSGSRVFPKLLRQAVVEGDEKTLASDLKTKNCMRVFDAVDSGSGVSLVKISDRHRHELCSKEFDKLYLRGCCREAMDCGCSEIIFSDDSVQVVYKPNDLLDALRSKSDIDELLGINKKDHRHFEIYMK